MIATVGYDGFLYSIGYLAGWIVALFVVAEPMKRLGKYTFTDAVDSKYDSRGIKLAAAISTLIVCICYLIPQMVGAGVLVEPLLGIPHHWGVIMVGAIVITIVATAGMASTTYVQFIKGGLLIVFSLTMVIAVCVRGFSTRPDQGGAVPFYSYAALPASEKDGQLTVLDPDSRVVEIQEVKSVKASFAKLVRDGKDTWWLLARGDAGTVLKETQSVVTGKDGQKFINGDPARATNTLRQVSNLEALRGQKDVAGGAVGPIEFLAAMADKDTRVNRWKDATFTDKDGAKVTVYFPAVTPGNLRMRPGLTFKVQGTALEKFDFVSLMIALFFGTAERTLHLSGPDARARTVRLRAALGRDEHGQAQRICATIEDVTAAARHEADRESLIERLQTSLLFLHEPAGQVGRSAVSCRLNTPIERAAALMTEHGSSAVLVQSESGEVLGIVTDRDLRERVLAAGADVRGPIHRIMSAPVVSISERAQVYEAMLTMQEKGVQHLVVQDDAGRTTGVIHGRELLQMPSHGAVALVREIARAGRPEEVSRCCRRTPGLVKALLDCGAHPHRIAGMIASVWDAATERLVALATAELGPAPAGFTFIVLGSQGRQEQTLFTDQDNAIIYAAPDEAGGSPDVSRYFLELGSRVCEWLNDAGHPFCRGNVMAKNPKGCQPLPAWKPYFTEWIRRAEPQELLEFSIFFDFRTVCGDIELARELRRHVHQTARTSQAFFPHFAQNSLLFKPPARLFGRILGGAAGGEHPGFLDLKDAMMPIVNFARLYTLRHELSETNTLDRLDALARQHVLTESSHEEIVAAYDFLMRLRLRHQAAAIRAGHPADNLVNYRKLSHIEEALLKQAFAQIDAVQKKISYDFLGGT